MTRPTWTRYCALIGVGILLSGAVADVSAQSAAIADIPVIYDVDRLPADFHKSRRDSVLAVLPDNGVALFFSAPGRNRANDVDYEYQQASDLYYLTGTHEPNSVLILAPGGITVDGAQVSEVLMVPLRNPATEQWTGRLLGPERAAQRLGVGAVVGIDRYEEIVTALLTDSGRRLYHLPLPATVEERSTLARQLSLVREKGRVLDVQGGPMMRFAVNRMFTTSTEDGLKRNQALLGQRIGRKPFEETSLEEVYDRFVGAGELDEWISWKRDHLDAMYADGMTLRVRLDELRMVKTDEELALLRRAIDVTAAAHREAMRSIEPGMYEYEVEALVEYVFRRNGAEAPGYPSIVGSGENSVVLHYETNRRRMQAGDLVVMDIGAEYHGYSADVTRTVPVSGTFSREQRQLYEIVLQALEAGVEAARAGLPFSGTHQAAFRVVADGLRELGLAERDQDVRRFFMHGTSHYIGLYVHDVGTGGPFVPGTVITVEPGIYISPSPDVDPKWWNTGIRIEEDVLVTEGDPIVLSSAAPRTVEAIEALMKERGLGNEPAGVVAPGTTNR